MEDRALRGVCMYISPALPSSTAHDNSNPSSLCAYLTDAGTGVPAFLSVLVRTGSSALFRSCRKDEDHLPHGSPIAAGGEGGSVTYLAY